MSARESNDTSFRIQRAGSSTVKTLTLKTSTTLMPGNTNVHNPCGRLRGWVSDPPFRTRRDEKSGSAYREYLKTFCGGSKPAFNLGSEIGAPGTTGNGNTPAQIGSA
jgi:hypothetical protein